MAVLYITPTKFTASNGKLDSDLRYIYKVDGASSFVFPIGRTLDLPTRGIVYNLSGVQKITGTYSGFTASFDWMEF